MSEKITIAATIQAPVNEVFEKWTLPEHIINWNFASDDWHCPKATNEVEVGGKLCATMAAKNGEMSFDFIAVYSKVIPNKLLVYTMEDGREVEVQFQENGATTEVVEIFDAEDQNPLEMQQAGWQAILNNFKAYIEK